MVVASSMKMVELTPTLHHKGAMSVFAYNPEDKEGFFFFFPDRGIKKQEQKHLVRS